MNYEQCRSDHDPVSESWFHCFLTVIMQCLSVLMQAKLSASSDSYHCRCGPQLTKRSVGSQTSKDLLPDFRNITFVFGSARRQGWDLCLPDTSQIKFLQRMLRLFNLYPVFLSPEQCGVNLHSNLPSYLKVRQQTAATEQYSSALDTRQGTCMTASRACRG